MIKRTVLGASIAILLILLLLFLACGHPQAPATKSGIMPKPKPGISATYSTTPQNSTPQLTTSPSTSITLTTTASSTQTGSITRTFGGEGMDWGYSVKQTSDGGYIITGGTGSFNSDHGEVYLIKTDQKGNEVWYRTLGGGEGHSVQQTDDGGYIVVGYSLPGWENVYLIKTDQKGNEVWSRTFGGEADDKGYSVQQTSDGGYVVVGYAYSDASHTPDVYLIKTDREGKEVWNRTFGGNSNDYGYSVQQTSDGGYIITGYTESFGAGEDDVYLIKTDSEGNEVWSRTFGGTASDLGFQVQQTKDEGYIIIGRTESFGSVNSLKPTPFGLGKFDVYLIKTDQKGNEVWSHTYGGKGYDTGESIQQTSDGGYVIVGLTDTFGSGKWDVYLIKTDRQGNEVWYRTFGGTQDDQGYSVQQTSDGGYVITGITQSFGPSSAGDVYLIKTDAEGNAK
jgi:hypothetical protein